MRGVLPCLSLSKEAVAPDARFSIARLRPRRSVPVAVASYRASTAPSGRTSSVRESVHGRRSPRQVHVSRCPSSVVRSRISGDCSLASPPS